MADMQPQSPPGRNHINVSEAWEVAHWSRMLGITKQQLLAAVHKVGPSIAGVKNYLKL